MTEQQTSLDLPPVDRFMNMDPIDLVGVYRTAVERIDSRVFEFDHEKLDRRFDESDGVGAMSCRELLCHLADTEVVMAHRFRRVLAEDAPVLNNWDHDAFWSSPLYGQAGRSPGDDPVLEPVGALAAVTHSVRLWTASTLYQISPADWDRKLMHPDHGEMNLRALVAYTTWHFEHHVVYLNAKILLTEGPKPEPNPNCEEGAKAGGCGAGCACVGASAEQA